MSYQGHEVRDPEDFQRSVDDRRRKRMATIDSLPPDIRELVHEYGFHVVDQFQRSGVTKAKNIRHLVECVLDEFSPTRGSFSIQGRRVQHDTALLHTNKQPEDA